MSNNREELILEKIVEVEKLLPDGIDLGQLYNKLLGGEDLPPVICAISGARQNIDVELLQSLPREVTKTMFDIVLMSAMLGYLEGRKSGIRDYHIEVDRVLEAGSEG